MTGFHPSVGAEWLAKNKNLEGRIPWPYLDKRGLPTVAVGILLNSLADMARYHWTNSDTRAPATSAEVAAAWHALTGATGEQRWRLCDIGAAEARKLVRIELSDDELDRITLARFDAFARVLLGRFPALPSWPVPAQWVMMSLAWAAGPMFAFPKMQAHLERGDFLAAADEVNLNVITPEGIKNLGLVERNRRNKALMLEAAAERGQVPAPPEPTPTDPLTDGERAAILALNDATTTDSLAEQMAAFSRSRLQLPPQPRRPHRYPRWGRSSFVRTSDPCRGRRRVGS